MSSGAEWCARRGHSWRMVLPDLDYDDDAVDRPTMRCDECGLRLRTVAMSDDAARDSQHVGRPAALEEHHATDCSCGWRGVLWVTPEAADNEFRAHVERGGNCICAGIAEREHPDHFGGCPAGDGSDG